MTIALLTAAGSGTRMHQDIPKQFIHVDNKPVIIHTMEAFQKHPGIDAIIVVTIASWTDVLRAYARQFNITKLKWIVPGGETGQESIFNGLRTLKEDSDVPEDAIVMVHDGNRPMVSSMIISDSLATYSMHGSAVAVIPCTEVVFESDDGISSCTSTERERLFRTQTPHTYLLNDLYEAHLEAQKRGVHVEGVARAGLEGADAALAEHDLLVALAHDVLGGHEQLVDGAGRRVGKSVRGWKNLKGKTVLITGASGLIGSAIVDVLAQLNMDERAGITILAAGRSTERMESRFGDRMEKGNIHYYPFDALKDCAPDQFPDPLPDYLIHAAGNANPALYGKHPAQTMMTTILGTQSILQMAAAKPGSRVLYVSSSEVYGRKDTAEPFQEDMFGTVDILNPRSCYPVSRRAAETLCASAKAEYGVDFVVARPGHVYGPTMTAADNRASSQFPRDVAAGKDIVLKSSGSQIRSYCYILDCASAILTILLEGESGQAYNISNRDSIVTIRQMAEVFAGAAGRKVLFDLPTEQEKAVFNPMDNSSLDASRLESLGWKGLFDMETGAKRTLACLMDEMDGQSH